MLGTSGAVIMTVALLIFSYNLFTSLRKGAVAGRDPWDAATLEWMTDSPPKVHNFDFTPIVLSERPLWDHKYNEGMQIVAPDEPEEFHMPSYSWKPLFAAGFVLLMNVGLLLNTFHPGNYLWTIAALSVVGLVTSVWFWVSEPV